MQCLVRAAALALAALCTACATYVAPPYSTDYDSVDKLKTGALGKVAVSPFQPVNADAPVNRPTLRGAHFAAGYATFAKYIESAIARDLGEAGLLSADAATRLDGTIVVNDINVFGVATGEGKLEVMLTVSRGGQQRLRKTYRAATTFDSSFMGAIAVQQGQAHYPVLVHTLLKQVYADPEFLNAIRN